MPDNAPFLDLQNLGVRYSGQAQAAVDSVSLSLCAGEIGALIGPSGCGKTTLLRAVAGLERAYQGRITLGGTTVSEGHRHVAVEKRNIGMVFQDHALFPHLDVARNVAFGLHKLSAAERQKRVLEVLTLVGLEGLEARYPHQLSGGQQQRVALARALAPRPRLLLLDEPFSNLDADLRERLSHEVRDILKTTGITALFVTHDQLEAFAVGDVVGIMRDGHLHQWDTPERLYHWPATRFVAQFIGQGVLSPARLRLTGNSAALETLLGVWDLTADHSAAASDGHCDLLLRAEDVVFDAKAPVKAQLVRKAFRGTHFLYTLQLPSGDPILAHIPSHYDHAPGEWLGIRPRLQHLITFPHRNGTDRHGSVLRNP